MGLKAGLGIVMALSTPALVACSGSGGPGEVIEMWSPPTSTVATASTVPPTVPPREPTTVQEPTTTTTVPRMAVDPGVGRRTLRSFAREYLDGQPELTDCVAAGLEERLPGFVDRFDVHELVEFARSGGLRALSSACAAELGVPDPQLHRPRHQHPDGASRSHADGAARCLRERGLHAGCAGHGRALPFRPGTDRGRPPPRGGRHPPVPCPAVLTGGQRPRSAWTSTEERTLMEVSPTMTIMGGAAVDAGWLDWLADEPAPRSTSTPKGASSCPRPPTLTCSPPASSNASS